MMAKIRKKKTLMCEGGDGERSRAVPFLSSFGWNFQKERREHELITRGTINMAYHRMERYER